MIAKTFTLPPSLRLWPLLSSTRAHTPIWQHTSTPTSASAAQVCTDDPSAWLDALHALLSPKFLSPSQRQDAVAAFSSSASLQWLALQLTQQRHPEAIERVTSTLTERNAVEVILNTLNTHDLYDLTRAALIASLEWLEIPADRLTQAQALIRSSLHAASPEVRESAVQVIDLFQPEDAQALLRERLQVEPNHHLQSALTEALSSR